MLDFVGNPEDRFSQDPAQILFHRENGRRKHDMTNFIQECLRVKILMGILKPGGKLPRGQV